MWIELYLCMQSIMSIWKTLFYFVSFWLDEWCTCCWLTYYDCGLDRAGKYLTPLTGLLLSQSPENKIVTECLVKYEFLCSKLPFVYYAEQNKSWRNPLIASPLCSEVLITSCLKAEAVLYLGKLNSSCVKDKV